MGTLSWISISAAHRIDLALSAFNWPTFYPRATGTITNNFTKSYRFPQIIFDSFLKEVRQLTNFLTLN